MPSRTKGDGRRKTQWTKRSIVRHTSSKNEKGMISRLNLKVVKRPAKNEKDMVVYKKKSSFGSRKKTTRRKRRTVCKN